MRIKYFLFILIVLLTIGACSSKKITEREGVSFFKKIFDRNTYNIYRIDIQQGNSLPAEKVARLQPGLTKDQVSYLLGTPVTSSLFHRNRWSYIYYTQHGKTRYRELQKIILFFEGDVLSQIKKSKLKSKES